MSGRLKGNEQVLPAGRTPQRMRRCGLAASVSHAEGVSLALGCSRVSQRGTFLLEEGPSSRLSCAAQAPRGQCARELGQTQGLQSDSVCPCGGGGRGFPGRAVPSPPVLLPFLALPPCKADGIATASCVCRGRFHHKRSRFVEISDSFTE